MQAWKLSIAASFTYFVVMTGVLSVDEGAERYKAEKDEKARIAQAHQDSLDKIASAPPRVKQTGKSGATSETRATSAHPGKTATKKSVKKSTVKKAATAKPAGTSASAADLKSYSASAAAAAGADD